ncbi:arginase family protein [bacterium]|nr:arginase family protein [bacterium]
MNLNNVSFKGGFNFLGLPDEDTNYETSKAVVLPVPYDGTTSYKPGTRDGPGAIVSASRNVELYDHELCCEPINHGVHTLRELEPDMSGPEAMITLVESAVEALIADRKFPVMLGGEHSLSFGAVRAMKKKYGCSFSVLQLDAHADLRDSFENTRFNHASVMSRIIEEAPITQVGIRNISKLELIKLQNQNHRGIFWSHDLQVPSNC